MMTLHEAHLRLQQNGMRMTGRYRDWTINFVEDRDNRHAYHTDDLEDAVLMGGTMRRKRRDAQAARYAFA
jgi:hypothetical protein